MQLRILALAAALLVFTTVPMAEAAPEPVGTCDDTATVNVCAVQCIQPPCPVFVCVQKGTTVVCTDD